MFQAVTAIWTYVWLNSQHKFGKFVVSKNSIQQVTRPDDGSLKRDRNVGINPYVNSVSIQTRPVPEDYDSDNAISALKTSS